jgi:hypothetical protein
MPNLTNHSLILAAQQAARGEAQEFSDISTLLTFIWREILRVLPKILPPKTLI